MGIGFKELLIILVIVLLLFGAKRLRNIGSDLGGAIKGFRKAVRESEDETKDANLEQKPTASAEGRVIEGDVTSHKDKV